MDRVIQGVVTWTPVMRPEFISSNSLTATTRGNGLTWESCHSYKNNVEETQRETGRVRSLQT